MIQAGSQADAQPPDASPGAGVIVAAEALFRAYPVGRGRPPRAALQGVDLSISPGEWIALLGPNGSGKSTLVRLLSGVEHPDLGELTIFGHSFSDSSSRRSILSRLSVVFQRPGLDPLLTVRENLTLQGSLFGLTGRQCAARVSSIAATLDIADRLDDRVGTLSGGLQRRADLARALMSEPDFLILDEPTSGLDLQSRLAFIQMLSQARGGRPGDRPLTILMTTHLMDEAERAQRILMMAGGRIVADGSPELLRSRAGRRVIRAAAHGAGIAETEHILRECGLLVGPGHEDELVARPGDDADEAALEEAVLRLTRAGASFCVSLPDLGDAYLAITGRPLGSAAQLPAEAVTP